MLSTTSFAESGGAGNGGDGVICGENITLLDSYEAQKLRLTIDLENKALETQTWRSMVNVAVTRLRAKDEHTASVLYDYAMEIVNDLEKFQQYPDARGKHVYLGYDIIAEISDSLHVSIPEGCELRQLVSQRVPRFRLDYRYEISKSLWEKMSLQEQSLTVLHEAWYRIMLENGAEDSIATRYINGLVASREFEELTFAEYLEEIKATELKEYIVLNKSLAVKDKTVAVNLKSHELTFSDEEVCLPNFKMNLNIKESYSLLNRAQRYLLGTTYKNVCFKNSQLTRIELSVETANSGITLRLPFQQLVFDKAISSHPTIHFHDNGTLKEITGVRFSELIEMYYLCHGEQSFTQRIGCESGPFNFHETKVSHPENILFSPIDEKAIGFFNR